MSTLANSRKPIQRAYVPTHALAKTVSFDDTAMHVTLTDGRIITLPLVWFPLLYAATTEERLQYAIGAGGRSLHWESLDEDLSVAQFLAGGDQTTA
jgi:hypothetical protein